VKLVDLNVLLYVVSEDSARHEAVLQWWSAAVNGEEAIGLPWVVVRGFLRISTNPRAFPRPLAADEAIAKVDTWLGLENVRLVREQDNHWALLRSLIAETGMAGNLTTDAHLAAHGNPKDRRGGERQAVHRGARPRQSDCPAAKPDAHAHWKLNPPSWPVTSTTSPMKYSPVTRFASIVFEDSSSVSTPPSVTSAFA
jgi:uncharacterized protein